MRELLLCKRIEHVALILALVERFFKEPAAVFLFDARVMTGHNGVAAQNAGALVEPLELQIAVAVDAGVWRGAALVSGNEAVDDLPLEVV